MNNEFNSKDNDKVINIAENHGDVISDAKETAKNDVEIKNEGISHSTVTTNVYQNQPQEQKHTPDKNHLPLVVIFGGIIVFALSIVGIIALSKQPTEPTIQNSSVNSISNSIVNSTINLQPTATPTNTNVIVNKEVVKPNVERTKPATSKIVSSEVVTQPKATQSTKVIIKKETPKPTPTPTEPPNCAFTPQGC